ncbi:hypothetical protein [Fischerella thermalis]|uniref:hypothetical protein n=1 Tax=Fischerella thermalis TaxID=372787 RepID=UPI0011AFBE78|nr:hypothetical protein [Fischerella thermalis]
MHRFKGAKKHLAPFLNLLTTTQPPTKNLSAFIGVHRCSIFQQTTQAPTNNASASIGVHRCTLREAYERVYDFSKYFRRQSDFIQPGK